MSETATTPETGVEGGHTESSAAEALLKRWGAEEEPAVTEEDENPNVEQSAQADDADAEGESDSDESESGGVEIDVAGEKFKLPPAMAEEAKRIETKVKEIEAGATKRFQEAADLRKTAESQIKVAQQLQEIAVQQADLIADHKAVSRRIEQLSNIDVNALAEHDPVMLTKINAEWNQLQAAKQRLESDYQNAIAATNKTKQAGQAERLERLNNFAAKNIKGWSDDYSRTLLDFAVKDLGFDSELIRENVSESIIKALDLAYTGHKVRSTDPKAKMVVNNKTIKPGSNMQNKTNAKAAAEKANSNLKKSGKVDDAAMALLARMGAKKR